MLIDLCELSPSYVRSIAPYQPGKPISELAREMGLDAARVLVRRELEDRKSTRLNSSHLVISYAVFCLKKKNEKISITCTYVRSLHNHTLRSPTSTTYMPSPTLSDRCPSPHQRVRRDGDYGWRCISSG